MTHPRDPDDVATRARGESSRFGTALTEPAPPGDPISTKVHGEAASAAAGRRPKPMPAPEPYRTFTRGEAVSSPTLTLLDPAEETALTVLGVFAHRQQLASPSH
jgi:hypothetical protein